MAQGSGGWKRGLSRAILTAAGTTLTASSEDGSDPYFPSQAIYYANHSSNLDFVAILAVVPKDLQPHVRPIAAADYWGRGIRGAVARGIFNAHLVQRYKDRPYTRADMRVTLRTDSGSSPKTAQLAGMTDVLDEGDSLIIFPEGTRGPSDQVATFHAGLYRLARHAPQLPVVPVTLKHLGRVLPKGAIFPRAHPSQVIVHHPIYLGENESQEAFLARARQVIAAELQREG